MLKRFFNSPLFVGLMALAAVGVVYINVIQPMVGGNVTRRVADVVSPFTAMVGDVSPMVAAVNPFDRAAVGWVDNPGRDPFLPHAVKPQEMRAKEGEAPRAADRYTLAGTMVDPGARLAAVNGRMVREGDRLDDYRVDRIEPGIVWLVGPRGAESISVANQAAGKEQGR